MLAVVGGKGGVGRTTTTVGVAAALARSGADPLVVDGDLSMPDCCRVLGADPERVRAEGPVRPSGYPSLSVVRPEQGALAACLRRYRGWHGPVVVDCPPGCSDTVAAAVRAATASLLVTTDEPRSVSAGLRTTRVCRRLSAPVVASAARVVCGATVEALPAPVVSVPAATRPLRAPAVRDSYRTLAAHAADEARSAERGLAAGMFTNR